MNHLLGGSSTSLFIFLCTFGTCFAGPRNAIIDKFLEEYDGDLWPTSGSGEPTTVSVNIFINSLGSIDSQNMDFSMDIYLRQKWKDGRVTKLVDQLRGNTTEPVTLNSVTHVNSFWIPDLYFSNLKDAERHMITTPNIFLRIDKEGNVLLSNRLTLKLACNMDLANYPLDTQRCYIHLTSYAHTTNHLVFNWQQNDPVQRHENLQIAQFDLMGIIPNQVKCVDTYETGNFSCLHIVFKLQRQNGYHISQTYIPTIIIVMISWVSFWLDPNATPARVSLGVTTLLTLTTLASGVRSQLPPVSYMKAIDIWIGICMLYVFGGLLEFTLVNFLANSSREEGMGFMRFCNCCFKTKEERNSNTFKEEAKILDKICRVAFPTTFFLFNIFYWPYYLISGADFDFES